MTSPGEFSNTLWEQHPYQICARDEAHGTEGCDLAESPAVTARTACYRPVCCRHSHDCSIMSCEIYHLLEDQLIDTRLLPVNSADDMLPDYQNTPIGVLLGYQNLDWPFCAYARAELLIGMCMDHRKMLRLPDNFAYVLRAGGANLRRIEFKVSYAIAVGGVRAMCLIGHDDCGMVGLATRKETFIKGLVENAGWDRAEAEKHFEAFAPTFEIGDPIDFVRLESQRLRTRYPKLLIAPLFYAVREGRLYQVR